MSKKQSPYYQSYPVINELYFVFPTSVITAENGMEERHGVRAGIESPSRSEGNLMLAITTRVYFEFALKFAVV